MKKLLFAVCLVCLSFTAHAAWNQECFFGRCCKRGVLIEGCSRRPPVSAVCHKRCIDLTGPAGRAFIACKRECIMKNGVVERKTAAVVRSQPAQRTQPVQKAEPVKEEEPARARAAESSGRARLAVGKTVRIEGDQYPFPSNSDVPSAALKTHIAQKAQELKDLNYSKIIIEGYTDNTGNADYNNDLSKRRAQAVKNEFVKAGIPEGKIEAVGNGQENPVADNNTINGRKANRRVEITVK